MAVDGWGRLYSPRHSRRHELDVSCKLYVMDRPKAKAMCSLW